MRHRRRSLGAAIATAAVLAAVALPPPALGTGEPATDLPAGFTDGVPVGGEQGPEEVAPAAEPQASDPGATTSAATARYFGRAPWAAIRPSQSKRWLITRNMKSSSSALPGPVSQAISVSEPSI